MKLSGYMLVSLALSLALHLMLMLALSRLAFPPPRHAVSPAEKARRVPTMQTIDLRDLAKPALSPDDYLKNKATAEIRAELAEIDRKSVV